MNKVVIMICTYKRPKYLFKTLQSVLNLKYDLKNVQVVIVDNDEEESARETVDLFRDKLDIIYSIETKRGISYARNKCLEVTRNLNCDFVAFIDDDEVVSDCWLGELVTGISKFNADIVRGPVNAVYKFDVPNWYKKSIVNDFENCEDGKRLNLCFTGNVLMKKDIILNNSFDEKYALTGGEDTKFFMNLNKEGKIIKFCKNAIIYEQANKDRINFKYILKRAFRDSANYVLIEREVLNTPKIIRLAKAVTKLVLNIILLPISIIMGYKGIVRRVKNISKNIGELYGVATSRGVQGY